jgi:hypothetical protein
MAEDQLNSTQFNFKQRIEGLKLLLNVVKMLNKLTVK